MVNQINSVSLNCLINASEIRNQAISQNNSSYVPSLFEIIDALQEIEQNNDNTKSSNKVVQWVLNQISNCKKSEASPDNSSEVPNTTVSENIQQTGQPFDIKPQTANDRMQSMYEQLQGLNLTGAKIELVEKPPIGI